MCPKHVEQTIRSAIKIHLLHLVGILFPHNCCICVATSVLQSVCTHRSVVIHITLHYHLIYASRSLCYSVFMHHIVCVANCYTHYAALPSDICTTILCCQPLYTSQRLCCRLLYTLCCVAICFMHHTLVCNHRLYAYHFLCFHLLLLHIMLHYHVICASHSFASVFCTVHHCAICCYHLIHASHSLLFPSFICITVFWVTICDMLHTVSVAISYALDTVQPWGFTSVQKWNVLWMQSAVSGPNIEDLSTSRYALYSLQYHAISISVIYFRGNKRGYQ
jgi:hypothetical protein